MRRVLALVCVCLVLAAVWFAYHAIQPFLSAFNSGNPVSSIANQFNPPAGSVGWKLEHGQRVNILVMGYGGPGANDAPYLTDSDMVLSINPATNQAMMASIPRDLKVQICAYTNGSCDVNKFNVAYSTGMLNSAYTGKKPQFSGADKDRGGNLAMQTASEVTGLHFDGYAAFDFDAFKYLVDDLGGVDVCLTSPLDDYQYPNNDDGYIAGGIHFKAGCQHVNGTQALELARSRHAIQASQATDFARIARQQLLIEAIMKKAESADAITRAPQLMQTLQTQFSTDLSLTDLRILYDWYKKVGPTGIGKVAVTLTNFLYDTDSDPSCADGAAYAYYECPLDPSWGILHQYFSSYFVPPRTLAEKAPIQVANASYGLSDMGPQVVAALQPLGLDVTGQVRVDTSSTSTVYDYSPKKDGKTAQWLATYFGAKVVNATSATPVPSPDPPTGGILLVLGRNFSLRWVGETT
ncbi:MAG TPA: LCP family protein [Candidatus Dormibacteraeota bacterium]|nr:LCP family protein [Candidatus Dormibacteraeota bacterium]